MTGLETKEVVGLRIHDMAQFRFSTVQSGAFAYCRLNAPTKSIHPEKRADLAPLLIKRIVKFGQLKCKEISL